MALKPLDKISTPNLVASSTQDWKQDMINKIQLDPEWDAIWDGDLYQNAFQMIMELGAYLAKKNAISSNVLIKEKFLNQSFSLQAINDNLADMRVSLQQTRGSSVTLQATLNGDILTESVIIPKFTQIFGTNPNGERVAFEIIDKDVDDKFNYFDNIVITPSVEFKDYFEIDAYAGTTFNYEYEIVPEMKENAVISIADKNIIEDSIRVFYITIAGARVELPYTDSFVVEPLIINPYFPNGIPHYTLKYNYDGSVLILLGSESFGGAFDDTHLGQYIRVYGRSGGGASTNVNSGKINYKVGIAISGGRTLDVTFSNADNATGGMDREDLYKAQMFAPYRFGRDKTMVDAQDAQTATYSTVVKHEISSPQYSEDPDFANVPVLHAYHRIVPIRDFDTFVFPDIADDDTLTTYNAKFLTALNTFCNVYGSHDVAVVGEEVTDFVYPDINDLTFISYIPEHKYPLSSSLVAKAYDSEGRILDSITWNSNYIVDQREVGYSVNTPATEHATVTSAEFSTITILNNSFGRNDRLVFSFDYDTFGYIFTIDMTTGIKTYQGYAEELQAAIVADIDANASSIFGPYRDWQFVSYVENSSNSALGRIVFTSPLTGGSSTIEFYNNGTDETVVDEQYNIYLFLEVQEKLYRPANETGQVFDTSNNIFKYNSNIITLNFKDRYFIEDDVDHDDLGITVDHSSVTGPLVEKILLNEEGYLEKLFDNYDMTITAYDSSGAPLDHIIFADITEAANTIIATSGSGSEFAPIMYTPGVIFKNTSENVFEYDEAKFYLRLKDNLISSVYTPGYPTIYRVDIIRIIETSPGVYEEDNTFTPIEFLESSANYTYDVTQSLGAAVTLTLSVDQSNTIGIGDNLIVKFIHRDGTGALTVVETAKILDIEAGNINNTFETPETVEGVVDMTYLYGGNPGNRYERDNKILRFKFLDGTLDTSVTYYAKNYLDFDHVTIRFYRKTYDLIKIDYEPNPYFPEGEAATLTALLNSSSKRLIALENIIKTITFIPKPVTVALVVKRGYGVAEAIDAVTSQLLADFSYDNANYEHTVGSVFTLQAVKNSINKIATTYGIIDITISSAEDTDNTADDETKYKYKFISDELYEKLRLLENSNSQLSGLAALYKISVSGISEEIRA